MTKSRVRRCESARGRNLPPPDCQSRRVPLLDALGLSLWPLLSRTGSHGTTRISANIRLTCSRAASFLKMTMALDMDVMLCSENVTVYPWAPSNTYHYATPLLKAVDRVLGWSTRAAPRTVGSQRSWLRSHFPEERSPGKIRMPSTSVGSAFDQVGCRDVPWRL